MKTLIFENIVTKEQFVCPNVRDVRTIEGIEYLPVQKLGTTRIVLMRRAALRPVKINKVP